MTDTYFATALVSGHNVGITIHAKNIAAAFDVAEHHLQQRHHQNPQSRKRQLIVVWQRLSLIRVLMRRLVVRPIWWKKH